MSMIGLGLGLYGLGMAACGFLIGAPLRTTRAVGVGLIALGLGTAGIVLQIMDKQ